MSKQTKGFSNDPLYGNLNNNYAENVDFFSGKKIEVSKQKKEDAEFNKKEEETTYLENVDNEEAEDLAGVESLVMSFGNLPLPQETEIQGTEGLVKLGKDLLVALWELVKDIGRLIRNLFNNKLARVDSKIKYTEQKRKLNGIKDGPVNYPRSCRQLMIPSKITLDGDWVFNCAEIGIAFYERVIASHKLLKVDIKKQPSGDVEERKIKTVNDDIAKIVCGDRLGNDGLASSEILPGNKMFVVRKPVLGSPDAALTYFSQSSIAVSLRSPTFNPNPGLIDNAIRTMNHYRDTIESVQKNSSEIQREFEREVNDMIKHSNSDKDQRKYLNWLVGVNKRMISTTLQHAIQVIDALDDFVNAGVRT